MEYWDVAQFILEGSVHKIRRLELQKTASHALYLTIVSSKANAFASLHLEEVSAIMLIAAKFEMHA